MPVRAKESGKANIPRLVGCCNSHAGFGCGKLCKVLKTDPVSGSVIAAEGYHAGVKLCLGCANTAVYNWQVSFDELDFLMVAKIRAQAGKCGVPATREEVWAILKMLGVSPIRKNVGSAIPTGDR